MRIRLHFLPLLLVLISITVTTGVFATWKYAYNASVDDHSTTANISSVGGFLWSGADDLPVTAVGENHAWLIYNIVNATDAKGEEIGLNNPDSEINERINARLEGGTGWREGRDYFGSMAVSGGDEVSELFDAKSNGLSFVVQVESETVYYIYTTSVNLGTKGSQILGFNTKEGNPNIPIDQFIYPIYKTKLVRANKNSDFEIIETKRGKARSDWYDENRSNANATQIPSFDVTTWVETEMGEFSDPIWTFVGDDPTAYATKEMQHLYYKIKPTNTATYTVWTSNVDAEISIIAIPDPLDSALTREDFTPVATSSKILHTDGSYRVQTTWSATAGNTYYIEITGDDVMQFHIS